MPVPPQRARRRLPGRYDPAGVLARGGWVGGYVVPMATCLVREDRAGGRSARASVYRQADSRDRGPRARVAAAARAPTTTAIYTTGATLDACARALIEARVCVVARRSATARTLARPIGHFGLLTASTDR